MGLQTFILFLGGSFMHKHNIFFLPIALLLSFLVLFSCKLDTGKIKDQLEDQEDQLEDKAQLSPPSWIRGTWQQTVNGSVTLSFEFTADNMTQTASGQSTSFKELPASAVEEQTNNSTVYAVKLTAKSIVSTYKFEKKTASTLGYTITAKGSTVGPLTLTKQ